MSSYLLVTLKFIHSASKVDFEDGDIVIPACRTKLPIILLANVQLKEL